jgi:nitrate/nitrite transporter NarK
MGGEQIIFFTLTFSLIGGAIGYTTQKSHGHPFWVSLVAAIFLAHVVTAIMDPANTFRMIPMATLTYFAAFAPIIWLFGKVHARFATGPLTHRQQFPDHPFCPNCGFDLHQSPSPTCPECGKPADLNES